VIFQDFPGPGNLKKKNPGLPGFSSRGNPEKHSIQALPTRTQHLNFGFNCYIRYQVAAVQDVP